MAAGAGGRRLSGSQAQPLPKTESAQPFGPVWKGKTRMSITDTPERAGRLQRPAVLRARELGLLGRRTALAATLQTQAGFQASLVTILNERPIPEVMDLLDHLRHQMRATTEHLNNIQIALGRHDQGAENPG